MKTLSSSLFKTGLLFLILAVLGACKKDNNDDDPSTQPGDVKIQFEYVFGSNQVPWSIGQTMLHPKTGDTLNFSEFNFYVSNVRLQKADGSYWSEDYSYHLICAQCPEGSHFTLKDVPAGTYTGVELLLGVDSLRNVSGAQSGDLSPAYGMFWDWNSGYIMIKAEGHSPQSPSGTFTFHLGGFAGPHSVLTPRTFAFAGNGISVNGSKNGELMFWANPARLWHSSPSVSQVNSLMQPGAEAQDMATDFFSNISLMEAK